MRIALKKQYVAVESHTRAFSLVELSIVLVILGLLVGGILAGQSLIRAAELRSVGTEIQRLTTSMHTFRGKYHAMPGDMTNATAFWGAADGGDGIGTDCRDVISTTATTCNGDGDGWVTTATTDVYESFRMWQQLANAGLLEGTYTGTISAANASGMMPGVNVPASRISPAYWGVMGSGTSSSTSTNGIPAGRALRQTQNTSNNTIADSSVLNPEAMWNLDTKMDDGLPATGSILTRFKGNGTTTFCTTGAGVTPPGDAGSTYRLDNKNRDCQLVILNMF